MTARRGPDFDLDQALADPSFFPRQSDVPELLDRLAGGPPAAEAAERALLRLGAPAARVAASRFATAEARERALLVRLVARIARASPDDELVQRLVEALASPDPASRRHAARGLGTLDHPAAAPALTAALGQEPAPDVRRALVDALGKTGGSEALAALRELDQPLAEQRRAELRIERTLRRGEPSRFAQERALVRPALVALRCRRGLEELLVEELGAEMSPRVERAGIAGPMVVARLVGAPARLLRSRTMLSFGFPLPARPARSLDALAGAVIEALSSDEACQLLGHLTEGPVRYRLAFKGGGKRRALVWRVAEEVASRRPELVNDPSKSTWQIVVHEGGGLAQVELVPRFADDRFAYRSGDVPAASHPTIAAALVRIAGVRPDDVVWDPFVGSGLELCERARAGPYATLAGSDLDPRALEIARTNLDAAGAEGALLAQQDACAAPPFGLRPTLVLTNPPLGRRVDRAGGLADRLDAFLTSAASALLPGGRLVWISPHPRRTIGSATRAGLTSRARRTVDLGGFDGEIQVFDKPLAADSGRKLT